MALLNQFLVGCDPEFALLKGGGPFNVYGIPSIPNVSSDHGGRVVELHPLPNRRTGQVVEEIKDLLMKIEERVSPHGGG